MVSNSAARSTGCARAEPTPDHGAVSPASEALRQRGDPRSAPPPGGAAAGRRPAARPASTEQQLRRYRLHRNPALLDEVVERHRGIVESMAHAMAARVPPNVDVQDLVHAGMWGLMQAIASYEPDRCDQFQAFMRIRVRGAMLDELRHMDFLPRLFRRRVRERDAARSRLRLELEREPTHSELAAALGISDAALLRCPDPVAVRYGSADAEADRFEQLADHGIESPIEAITRQELLELIRRSLEPIEWQVLRLHYLEGMTGRQVARRLRLSASRICQIHGRVLDRLKQRLIAAATV